MSVKHFSATGTKQTAAVKLPETTLSDAGLSRVIRVQIANENRQRPKAKTRGLVRGGGAKPWRQKGTGRARAGTNNSPLWRGGGVIFGPTGLPRAKKTLPRGMSRAGVIAALAGLANDDRLSVVSGKLNVSKSRDAANLLAKIVPEGTALFVVTKDEAEAAKGIRNLAGIDLATFDDTSAADLVHYAQTVVTAGALEALTVVPKSAKAVKKVTKTPTKPATKVGSTS